MRCTDFVSYLLAAGAATISTASARSCHAPGQPGKCHGTRCLRQMQRPENIEAALDFCATFTVAPEQCGPVPTFMNKCKGKHGNASSRISSACSCLATSVSSSYGQLSTNILVTIPSHSYSNPPASSTATAFASSDVYSSQHGSSSSIYGSSSSTGPTATGTPSGGFSHSTSARAWSTSISSVSSSYSISESSMSAYTNSSDSSTAPSSPSLSSATSQPPSCATNFANPDFIADEEGWRLGACSANASCGIINEEDLASFFDRDPPDPFAFAVQGGSGSAVQTVDICAAPQGQTWTAVLSAAAIGSNFCSATLQWQDMLGGTLAETKYHLGSSLAPATLEVTMPASIAEKGGECRFLILASCPKTAALVVDLSSIRYDVADPTSSTSSTAASTPSTSSSPTSEPTSCVYGLPDSESDFAAGTLDGGVPVGWDYFACPADADSESCNVEKIATLPELFERDDDHYLTVRKTSMEAWQSIKLCPVDEAKWVLVASWFMDPTWIDNWNQRICKFQLGWSDAGSLLATVLGNWQVDGNDSGVQYHEVEMPTNASLIGGSFQVAMDCVSAVAYIDQVYFTTSAYYTLVSSQVPSSSYSSESISTTSYTASNITPTPSYTTSSASITSGLPACATKFANDRMAPSEDSSDEIPSWDMSCSVDGTCGPEHSEEVAGILKYDDSPDFFVVGEGSAGSVSQTLKICPMPYPDRHWSGEIEWVPITTGGGPGAGCSLTVSWEGEGYSRSYEFGPFNSSDEGFYPTFSLPRDLSISGGNFTLTTAFQCSAGTKAYLGWNRLVAILEGPPPEPTTSASTSPTSTTTLPTAAATCLSNFANSDFANGASNAPWEQVCTGNSATIGFSCRANTLNNDNYVDFFGRDEPHFYEMWNSNLALFQDIKLCPNPNPGEVWVATVTWAPFAFHEPGVGCGFTLSWLKSGTLLATRQFDPKGWATSPVTHSLALPLAQSQAGGSFRFSMPIHCDEKTLGLIDRVVISSRPA